MAIVLGSFGTETEAEDAMDRLREQGFGDEEYSLISHADDAVGAPEDDSQRANTQVTVGAVGAAGGAILGGLLLGPVGAVIGGVAAGGGLAALLRPHGATDTEIEDYQRRLHEGRFVLATRVDTDERADAVRRVLAATGADDVRTEH